MSLVTSFQLLADICPHHKPIKSGRVPAAGSPGWGSVQCWNGKGCRCAGRISLLKLVRCLPAQCLALLLAASLESYFLTAVRWKLKRKNRTTLVSSFTCNFYGRCRYLEDWVVCAAGFFCCGICCKLVRLCYFCSPLCGSWNIAWGCLVQLSACKIRVLVCQRKVTFRMAWKSIFHMLGETVVLPALHNDLYLARTCKIVSLADCQKLHHIGVNCF